jgi:hypothetical protein
LRIICNSLLVWQSRPPKLVTLRTTLSVLCFYYLSNDDARQTLVQ